MEGPYLKGGILDNYILRIYRRKKHDPRILVGVVEEVGVQGSKAFSNLDELWSILNPNKNQPTWWRERKGLEEP
jgi:hypothetical protein